MKTTDERINLIKQFEMQFLWTSRKSKLKDVDFRIIRKAPFEVTKLLVWPQNDVGFAWGSKNSSCSPSQGICDTQ